MAVERLRGVPPRLAGVVRELAAQPGQVVTVEDLNALAQVWELGMSGVALGYDLRRRGWLSPLRTRGAWVSVPPISFGGLGSSVQVDPHIELRAALAVDPDFPGMLAMESAAAFLGLGDHLARPPVLAVPRGFRVPVALRNWRTLTLDLPGAPAGQIDGLPVWRLEALIAGMATRSDAYRDWDGVARWIYRAATSATTDLVISFLDGAPRSAWLRAAYFLHLGQASIGAARVAEQAPPGRGPVYLGPRDRKGRFHDRFGVIDSVLVQAMVARP